MRIGEYRCDRDVGRVVWCGGGGGVSCGVRRGVECGVWCGEGRVVGVWWGVCVVRAWRGSGIRVEWEYGWWCSICLYNSLLATMQLQHQHMKHTPWHQIYPVVFPGLIFSRDM